MSAAVWAEMKKETAYKVDVSFNSDAVVQEAQCECGAGRGPNAHCKHVAAVLYGPSCYVKTGDVLTELTCTQVTDILHLFGTRPSYKHIVVTQAYLIMVLCICLT